MNRDIEGMLKDGAKTEKAQKILSDARDYRKMLEDDILLASKKAESDEPSIIGVIIIEVSSK